MGLDSRFKEISAKLKGLKPGDSAALKRRQTYLNKVFAEIEKSYGDLQSQHETELEHLSELQSDFKKSLIEYSTYDVQRVKSITNRRRIEE